MAINTADAEKDGGATLLAKKTEELRNRFISFKNLFIEELKKELTVTGRSVKEQQTLNMWAFLFTAIIACSLTSVISSRFITRPIKKAIEVMKEVADGNLTKRLEIKSRDEIGEMGKSFNMFIDKLEKMIFDISRDADELKGSAFNLNELSVSLLSGSDQMA